MRGLIMKKLDFNIIIPARLKSTRLPRKVLHEFFGLPMLEHVRRRALLVDEVSRVIVATCDDEIYDLISSYGGDVIMTSDRCKSGTERIAEAAKNLSCDYAILLQGDEPCFYPKYIESLISYVKKSKGCFYNLVSPILNKEILFDISSVKCSINSDNEITGCFRKTPYISGFHFQKTFIKKLLGIMCFDREFLVKNNYLKPSELSNQESIEQLSLLENKILMQSLLVNKDIPSLNVYDDIKKLELEFTLKKQQIILKNILK